MAENILEIYKIQIKQSRRKWRTYLRKIRIIKKGWCNLRASRWEKW